MNPDMLCTTPPASKAAEARQRLIILALLSLTLSACAPMLRTAERPGDLPAHWNETSAQTGLSPATLDNWWEGFGSSQLGLLITDALYGSPDINIAAERVLQAELAARNVGANLLPSVNLDAASSIRHSDTPGSAPVNTRASSLGLSVSYEIDLWGSRISAQRGSLAQLSATRYDYQAARLSLASAVANTYLQVLALQARIDIAQRNLDIAERLFTIVQARHRHGAASALDVSRQRSTVLAQRDALLPLQTQARQSLRALALLQGTTPQQLNLAHEAFADLIIPEVPLPTPSELPETRPDLAAIEARLLAADANIAVARANLFPVRLNLGAQTVLSGAEFGLTGLTGPTSGANLALSLVQAIFDGGRLRNQLAITESQQRQLLEEYRRAILTAIKETEDAVGALTRNRQQQDTQRDIVEEASNALRLAEARYRQGSDPLSTLLDTQRTLFSAQDQLLQLQLAGMQAAIDLFKAIGGIGEI